jgi:hypothetical protein
MDTMPMLKSRRRSFGFFTAVVAGWLTFCNAASASELSGRALVEALRAGGLTIYFRHTQTDWSKDDHVGAYGDWQSCDPEKIRQLSDAGRATAKAVGQAIRALAIPVSRVLSSEYCRAKETVALMELGPVETTPDIMNLRSADYVGGRAAAIGRIRKIFATLVAPGGNVVIGAHGNLIQASTGIYPGEGGSAVFRADPNAEHGFSPVARLDPKDWAALARQFANGG